jgi:hypothetical protein
MARSNPRRRIDQQAAEAARAIAERRDAVLPSDYALDRAAAVTRSDVNRSVSLWREANAGTETARLLDGPPGKAERDG